MRTEGSQARSGGGEPGGFQAEAEEPWGAEELPVDSGERSQDSQQL